MEALSKYGAAAAIPTLRTALGDKDWAVRVRAAELLKSLDATIETAQAIRPAPVAGVANYDLPSLTSPAVSPHVYIEMEKGTIEIELDVLDAPITASNFITLARKGYFDGLTFHRVVRNFVAQAGDPRGDGEGGPGYTIRTSSTRNRICAAPSGWRSRGETPAGASSSSRTARSRISTRATRSSDGSSRGWKSSTGSISGT